MSNNRLPHPNEHPHDDDLQPEREADASMSDADALDDLLNEIAQGNGSRNTRSGNRRQRPNVRFDTHEHDSEARVLQAATHAFHRRFDSAQARDPGAMALDPALWENIMASTTAQPKQLPGVPGRAASSEVPVLNARLGSRTSAPVTHIRAHRWGGFANATLALVILLAGFGIWRFYDGLNSSGGNDPESTSPGLAMQPATPEATVDSIEVPAATPAPAFACDFSGDIPIFADVDAAPVDGTALVLTTNDELMLTCPEEPEPIVLAAGIDQVSPMSWPGIVFNLGKGEPGAQAPSMLNVMTGKSVEIGIPPAATTYQWTQPEGSPWLVAASFDDPNEWAVTDLRTMESRMFRSAYGGAFLPEDTLLMAAASGDTLVVAPHAPNGDFLDDGTLPGRALVLQGSFGQAHWIDLPGELLRIREFQVSPDGRFLAIRASTEGQEPARNTTYSIVRIDDGVEVARSGTFEDPISTMRWVQEGKMLAYTENTSLMLISTEPDQEPVVLLEGNDALGELQTTYDPDVVIVHRIQKDELSTEIPMGIEQRVHSVNTVTGDQIEISGRDMSYNTSPSLSDTRFLVMYEPVLGEPGSTDYQVIDAVTGEVVDEIADVPQPNGDVLGLGWRSVVSTDDGSTEVIAFGAQHIYLMTVENGEPVVRHIPAPSGIPAEVNGVVDMFLAPNGAMLSLTLNGDETRTRWMLPLDDKTGTWTDVPSTIPGEDPGYIFFVPGTGS